MAAHCLVNLFLRLEAAERHAPLNVAILLRRGALEEACRRRVALIRCVLQQRHGLSTGLARSVNSSRTATQTRTVRVQHATTTYNKGIGSETRSCRYLTISQHTLAHSQQGPRHRHITPGRACSYEGSACTASRAQARKQGRSGAGCPQGCSHASRYQRKALSLEREGFFGLLGRKAQNSAGVNEWYLARVCPPGCS